MERRVLFLVDGFNFYHSVRDAAKTHPNAQIKWVDIKKLCATCLMQFPQRSQVCHIDYFTSYPNHLTNSDPQKLERHKRYVKVICSTGIEVHLGKIVQQKKSAGRTSCLDCKSKNVEWVKVAVEKGTDVTLAATLFERAQQDRFDDAVIISGDSDYFNLVAIFTRMYPSKTVRFGMPFGRGQKQLLSVKGSFKLSADLYKSCQLPETCILQNGEVAVCPAEWRGQKSCD